MKMFYYTRKEKINKPEVNGQPQPEEFKEFTDGFNLDKVLRTVGGSDGRMLVSLHDFHEEVRDVPNMQKGKMVGYKKERNTYQSEIILEPSDAERFVKLTNVE